MEHSAFQRPPTWTLPPEIWRYGVELELDGTSVWIVLFWLLFHQGLLKKIMKSIVVERIVAIGMTPQLLAEAYVSGTRTLSLTSDGGPGNLTLA